MRTQATFRHIKTPFVMIFSFIVGSMFTISITPIDKTCKLQNTDREHNIMNDSKLKNPDVIILIISAPKNIDKRNTVRETWLRLYKPKSELFESEEYKIRHYFVVGSVGLNKQELSHLNGEQNRHNDLLLIPIHDTYRNLASKVKRSFEWLDLQHDYGLVYKYVLKCDDDSFVHLPKLIEELSMLDTLFLKPQIDDSVKYISASKNKFYSLNVQINNRLVKENMLGLYWGYFSGNAKIKLKGKWKETDWIFSDRYLPYALGGGYLLSKNLVRYIGKNAGTLRSFTSEDVSVGLWLAPLQNILRVHDIRFDTEWTTRGCQNTNFIIHNISKGEMMVLFQNILTKGVLCNREIKRRNHYIYNWSVPPSECCKSPYENVISLGKH